MFVASRTIASRPLVPMTDEQLHRVAPSIFAESPHASRSTRYAQVPTIKVVEGLRANGFLPVLATQAKVRDNSTGRQDYTKHMVRFR
jgi:hypothetical protein